MNLRGGVIIIGSLLWEETPTRSRWKRENLEALDKKNTISVPIRYGRQSSSRKDTFTMILSNNVSTKLGQAYILGFKENISDLDSIRSQAIALAVAEGLCTVDNQLLNKSWGTVGMLVNPKIDGHHSGAHPIRDYWTQLRQENCIGFNHFSYRIDNDENPVIDKDGFLQIPWRGEMDGFDFLLATPVVPKPRRILTSREIAERMTEKGYWTYFENNRSHGILTFQDQEILEYFEVGDQG